MTHTWSLKADECAWQVPPTDPFVASPRNDTWSVREIHTPFENARVCFYSGGQLAAHTPAARGE